jgi:hypothetical protein
MTLIDARFLQSFKPDVGWLRHSSPPSEADPASGKTKHADRCHFGEILCRTAPPAGAAEKAGENISPAPEESRGKYYLTLEGGRKVDLGAGPSKDKPTKLVFPDGTSGWIIPNDYRLSASAFGAIHNLPFWSDPNKQHSFDFDYETIYVGNPVPDV